MSELDPAQDPEYAAALDRFLDGLLDDPVSAADAQVRADTDAITRALSLIGGTLAAEGGGVTAAAGAVPPVAAGGATVVPLSSWRSKLNPRVLAAAASLVVVLGVGIPLSMSATSGSDSDDAATAMDAPNSQAESAATGAAPAPVAPGAVADTYAGTDTAAAAVPGATDAGTGTGTAAAGAATGGAARDTQALEAADATSPTAGKAAPGAPAANAAFADAVACARAIFVGNITNVAPDTDGAHFKVTFLVTEWIAPASGPVTVTYRIYGSTANSPGVDENVQAGQRRLFVVPASEEDRISAYREKDWAETRKQIKAVRDERAGQGC